MTRPEGRAGAASATAGGAVDASGSPQSSPDAAFFAAYEWCLNPLISLREALEHMRDELDRRESLAFPWQREEAEINIFLLSSAACCAADDYLAHRPWNLARLARRLPRLGAGIKIAERTLNLLPAVARAWHRPRIRRFRRELERCADSISEILVEPAGEAGERWVLLRAAAKAAAALRLPAALLGWCARIPDAFRCQDLSHHDAVALARLFAQSRVRDFGPFIVVGVRTSGAYFAPLVKASLARAGLPARAWLTFRPKEGVGAAEVRRFRKLIAGGARVLLVDDTPNTGDTLVMMAALLRRWGIAPENIVVLAPDHPAQLDWKRALAPVPALSLSPRERHKERLLDDPVAVEAVLRELYGSAGWQEVRLQASTDVAAANARLSARFGDDFDVRLKRVFEVQLLDRDRPPEVRRVLAKSVGWGWLGYHAYLAAARLADFVPPLVGLRHGILFTEWIGEPARKEPHPDVAEIAAVVPSYVAARAARLRLPTDPGSAGASYPAPGRETLATVLAHPYGRYLRRLMTGRLSARLQRALSCRPSLVDGRMGPEEWLCCERRIYKVDFEHHNFGGGQPNIVDPGYDLAAAVHELALGAEEERHLLASYEALCGDEGVHSRLLPYKLLCGISAMAAVTYWIGRVPMERREELNRRYNAARDFLVFQMSRHCAESFGPGPRTGWSKRLFFLDLDGVFDFEFFGPFFQHTTPSGLSALRLLKAHGYAVVINSGRSVKHIRDYCRNYALPGGIGEYGSIFVDAVRQREEPLVDGEAQEQLSRCREALRRLPAVYLDPGYEWAIRAYRYGGATTLGLATHELEDIVSAFDRLSFVARHADSYIVQKDASKGSAVAAVKERIAGVTTPVVAIGDSVEDIDMLEQADIAYVPGNFPKELLARLSGSKYRAVREPLQRGLLAAVRDLTRGEAVEDTGPSPGLRRTGADGLIDALLRAADRRQLVQALDLLLNRV